MTTAEVESLIARLQGCLPMRSKHFENSEGVELTDGLTIGDLKKIADALASLLAERDRLRGAGGISKRSLHADYDRLTELLGRARSALRGEPQ